MVRRVIAVGMTDFRLGAKALDLRKGLVGFDFQGDRGVLRLVCFREGKQTVGMLGCSGGQWDWACGVVVPLQNCKTNCCLVTGGRDQGAQAGGDSSLGSASGAWWAWLRSRGNGNDEAWWPDKLVWL